MAFVDLAAEAHTRPQRNHEYGLVSAGDSKLEALPFAATEQKLLDIDVYEFFSGDLPEGIFGGSNEGLLRIRAHTSDPQSITEDDAIAAWLNEFEVDDDEYASGFLFRGVFRNILVRDFANLSIDLFEMDGDASESYDKFKSVVDKVPELKNLDVLKGIPYLSIATQLFDGAVQIFGKNPDDHLWADIPILEFDPIIGGAFLRNGIYVIFERERDGKEIAIEDMSFKNYRLESKSGTKLGAHLVMGVRVKPFSGAS